MEVSVRSCKTVVNNFGREHKSEDQTIEALRMLGCEKGFGVLAKLHEKVKLSNHLINTCKEFELNAYGEADA